MILYTLSNSIIISQFHSLHHGPFCHRTIRVYNYQKVSKMIINVLIFKIIDFNCTKQSKNCFREGENLLVDIANTVCHVLSKVPIT
jgi:hypothetical protein